jgi:hypothetical protein
MQISVAIWKNTRDIDYPTGNGLICIPQATLLEVQICREDIV